MTDPRRESFTASLGFGLDEFQEVAFDAVDAGRNVLVSAPTGSGKTIIATYAVARHLAEHRRSFYTTPLKALSNQKFRELVERFGLAAVGLLTGDVSVNRDAPIVVMTTEVLRNMLLTESRQIPELGAVVLDEVHYLQDPFRGGVWEEVIILTPPGVQFVALSATVANAGAFGEWISSVRGPTELVVERSRPIRLHDHVAVRERGSRDLLLVDLLDAERLSDEGRRIDNAMRSTRRFQSGARWRGPAGSGPTTPFLTPRRGDLLAELDERDLLPAIYFIFSRAGCDAAVGQMRREGHSFTTAADRRRVEAIADAHVATFTDSELRALEFPAFSEALAHGLAAHHAGMVPAFRETVEHCFEEGLLGVVFATETLALGVNMPARTVVLEQFTKVSTAGRATLTSGDFTQLTGRAGRRGLDDEGHAVVCFAPATPLSDVARVAVSEPPELHSSFRPTYNLTANLIHHFDAVTGVEVLERSYAQFESRRRTDRSRRTLAEQLAARHAVLEELGYARGWSLTPVGERLRTIYHECDLAVAESWAAGAFAQLEPAILAAVVSTFVHEPRRARRAGPHRATPSRRTRARNDRLGEPRRQELARRWEVVTDAVAVIEEVEERHGVPHAKAPSIGFAPAIAAWVRGASLVDVLDQVGADDQALSPGDFVRDAKQVADLLEQVGRIGAGTDVADVAAAARLGVVRSVVAGALSVPVGRGAQS